MDKTQLHTLAAELERYLGTPTYEGLAFKVWADDEAEEIYIAPVRGANHIFHYVKEVAVFAAYHDLTLTTENFETGAGLRLS